MWERVEYGIDRRLCVGGLCRNKKTRRGTPTPPASPANSPQMPLFNRLSVSLLAMYMVALLTADSTGLSSTTLSGLGRAAPAATRTARGARGTRDARGARGTRDARVGSDVRRRVAMVFIEGEEGRRRTKRNRKKWGERHGLASVESGA